MAIVAISITAWLNNNKYVSLKSKYVAQQKQNLNLVTENKNAWNAAGDSGATIRERDKMFYDCIASIVKELNAGSNVASIKSGVVDAINSSDYARKINLGRIQAKN
jgi:hypothetical protein